MAGEVICLVLAVFCLFLSGVRLRPFGAFGPPRLMFLFRITARVREAFGTSDAEAVRRLHASDAFIDRGQVWVLRRTGTLDAPPEIQLARATSLLAAALCLALALLVSLLPG